MNNCNYFTVFGVWIFTITYTFLNIGLIPFLLIWYSKYSNSGIANVHFFAHIFNLPTTDIKVQCQSYLDGHCAYYYSRLKGHLDNNARILALP